MQFLPSFPIDPNEKKNRVPGTDEMITLRNLAQRNERMMQDLDKQMEEEKNVRIDLQHRYKKLLELVECTQSEIVATERSSAMLAGQKLLIQTDQAKIKALIHPIRRCPSDVLQYLFEWAVEIDDDWFRCATAVSHVCCRWREVALQTPNLWTDIQISSESNFEDARAFWSRTIERVKSAPTTVIVTVADEPDAHLETLQQCRLDLLQNIKHLEFRLRTTAAAVFLSYAELYLPASPVGHLKLECGESIEIALDASAIVRRFPTARSLSISNAFLVQISSALNCPIMTTINIYGVDHISLQSLGQAFPNVETAILRYSAFDFTDARNIIWPKLKQLTVSNCENMPWGLLMAMDITDLSCSDDVNEEIVTFIASRRSLKALDILYSADHIHAIATSAAQLLRLTIDSCEEIADPTKMELNKLTQLGIYDLQVGSLTIELFEKIVRGRFLSKKAGIKSSGKTEPTSLEILVPESRKNERIEWQESELIPSAHREVSRIRRWNRNFTVYHFKWN